MTRSKEGRRTGGPSYFTTTQVAEALGVSAPTVVKWVKAGALAAHTTPGGHRRIAATELERFAAARGMRGVAGPAVAPNKPCIVVIDPGVEFSQMLREMLSMRVDLEVLVANDAFTSGFVCGGRAPVLVIVDPSMPDLDPWAALERLRKDSDTQVVALSAVINAEIRALRDRGLVDHVLGKPYDLPRLWELLPALLGR